MNEKGLTNKDLEKRMGFSKQYISNLINGNQNASISRLNELAEALGVGIGDLFENRSTGIEQPIVDDFVAMVRYKGEYYHADSIAELDSLIDDWKSGEAEK